VPATAARKDRVTCPGRGSLLNPQSAVPRSAILMPWFLYHALKQLFPTGRWFPFFTFMSGLGIAVGVALMYVASSVMGGFGHQIREMIVDSEGEVQVQGRSGVVQDPRSVL